MGLPQVPREDQATEAQSEVQAPEARSEVQAPQTQSEVQALEAQERDAEPSDQVWQDVPALFSSDEHLQSTPVKRRHHVLHRRGAMHGLAAGSEGRPGD